ncbi:MAG: ABC transporter permease [Bacteroidales bacterium]|nr:ABC transporter permease [Bacteroidales bacterium]
MQIFSKKNISNYSKTLLSILVIIVIWSGIGYFKIVNALFIPKIDDTFISAKHLLYDKTTYISLGFTVYRAIAGLLIAIAFGVPAGLIFGRINWIYKYFELPIEFFRAIPSSALFPLFILFFGIGNASKIGVVFYACSLIMLVNSYYGALPNQEKLDRINMLRSFGASNLQIFTFAICRDALPGISAGIRVCLSLSFVLVVVTEMFLSANEGIGKMIYDYYLQYRIPEMYATIIILGITGFVTNRIYILLEKKFLPWSKNV